MDDVAALMKLRAEVARDMSDRFGKGGWSSVPTKADIVRQLRASHVLVAREGAEVVGTVRLAPVQPGIIDTSAFTPVSTAIYVLGLAVAVHRRNFAIGHSLMNATKDFAQKSSANALWLDAYDHAAGAGPFYERCGFRRCGKKPHGSIDLWLYEWLRPVVE